MTIFTWLVRKSNLYENEWDNSIVNFPPLDDKQALEDLCDRDFQAGGADPGETTVTYSIERQNVTYFTKTYPVTSVDIDRGAKRRGDE